MALRLFPFPASFPPGWAPTLPCHSGSRSCLWLLGGISGGHGAPPGREAFWAAVVHIIDKKQGKHIIEVCTSGPCYVSKSKVIVDYLKEKLGIDVGETTPDKKFTLKSSSCIGACDISPVIKIGEKVYGNLTKDKVDEIIEELRI